MNKRHASVRDDDFDPEVEAWMRSHTVGDLKALAENKRSKGENVSGLMAALQALDEIEQGQLLRMGNS
ncbi:MAG: hypothetical protein SA339_07355 [Methanomassiliicoccus sp.]|nr:hypothetical protein [Methanomassiliicoccus sp.]